jgi:hypothetical protein
MFLYVCIAGGITPGSKVMLIGSSLDDVNQLSQAAKTLVKLDFFC